MDINSFFGLLGQGALPPAPPAGLNFDPNAGPNNGGPFNPLQFLPVNLRQTLGLGPAAPMDAGPALPPPPTAPQPQAPMAPPPPPMPVDTGGVTTTPSLQTGGATLPAYPAAAAQAVSDHQDKWGRIANILGTFLAASHGQLGGYLQNLHAADQQEKAQALATQKAAQDDWYKRADISIQNAQLALQQAKEKASEADTTDADKINANAFDKALGRFTTMFITDPDAAASLWPSVVDAGAKTGVTLQPLPPKQGAGTASKGEVNAANVDEKGAQATNYDAKTATLNAMREPTIQKILANTRLINDKDFQTRTMLPFLERYSQANTASKLAATNYLNNVKGPVEEGHLKVAMGMLGVAQENAATNAERVQETARHNRTAENIQGFNAQMRAYAKQGAGPTGKVGAMGQKLLDAAKTIGIKSTDNDAVLQKMGEMMANGWITPIAPTDPLTKAPNLSQGVVAAPEFAAQVAHEMRALNNASPMGLPPMPMPSGVDAGPTGYGRFDPSTGSVLPRVPGRGLALPALPVNNGGPNPYLGKAPALPPRAASVPIAHLNGLDKVQGRDGFSAHQVRSIAQAKANGWTWNHVSDALDKAGVPQSERLRYKSIYDGFNITPGAK